MATSILTMDGERNEVVHILIEAKHCSGIGCAQFHIVGSVVHKGETSENNGELFFDRREVSTNRPSGGIADTGREGVTVEGGVPSASPSRKKDSVS